MDGVIKVLCKWTPNGASSLSPPFPRSAPKNKFRRQSIWIRRAIGMGVGIGSGSGSLPFDPLHLVAHAGWPSTILSFVGMKNKTQRKKRIMIMYAKTGGGHRASAEALKSGFHLAFKDKYEVQIVDVWTEHAPTVLSQMQNSYSFLVRHSWLYWMVYQALNPPLIHTAYFRFIQLFCYNRLNEAFEIYKPDLVVSVHPLLQHIPFKILQDRIRSGVQRPIAFATVITDFTTCHNSWFHRGVNRCFVPTETCYDHGKRLGMRPDQLKLYGLPIRPEFAKHLPPKGILRRKLNMLQDVPAVLLVGGGEGMGSLEATVIAIERTIGADCQIVVVCGRNQSLAQRLRRRNYPEGMQVIVNGFVDNMNEWMVACDAVVTKAGPGTIAEALICGMPILLNGYIPGQETGNIPFVIENRVGAYERRPEKIAAILKEWFVSKREELKEMSIKAKALGRPDALFHIVHDLAALCEQPVFSPSLGSTQAVLA